VQARAACSSFSLLEPALILLACSSFSLLEPALILLACSSFSLLLSSRGVGQQGASG
jgi:competence protein ComGF